MRHVFHDDNLDREFEVQGYVVVRLISAAAAESAQARLREIDATTGPLPLEPEDKLIRSVRHPNSAHREAVDLAGRELLAEKILGLLDEYRVLSCGSMIKLPKTGELEVHRDWTITREEARPTISAWCTLEVTTPRNGALAVLPGSHRLPNIETAGVKAGYHRFSAALKRRSIQLSLQTGEAVLFDNRLLHWSAANRTERPRHALRAMLLPAEEPHVFYRLDTETEGSRFELILLDTRPGLRARPGEIKAPLNVPSLGFVANANRELSLRECEHVLRGDVASSKMASILGRLTTFLRG